MNKAENLKWFKEIMESKMMKHEEEDPTDINYKGLMIWLKDEIDELGQALQFESRENVIKECADVANMAYFIADKVKRRK